MGSFNWQDEESSWDATQDLADNEVQGLAKPNLFLSGRVGRVAGIIVVGLVGVGLALWWWVDSVEADLSDEVLESWRIVVASEAAGDIELFTNQLSGTNEGWIATQKELLKASTLSARGPLLPSLTISPTSSIDLAETEIVFSPDLTEATLSHPVVYHDRWGREVNLLQDEVFRLGADRWLFSPPRSTYWGEDSVDGEDAYSKRFVYSAPSKDVEIAEKIVLWFEDRLDAMCTIEFTHACHTNQTPQVAIRFLPTWSERMLKGKFYERRNSLAPHKIVFEFPAPSLIGSPKDSHDEQLLIEAYGEIYFADYLLNLAIDAGENSCLRSVVEYAAQQVNAVAPASVADFVKLLEYQQIFGEEEIFSSNAGFILSFRDEDFTEMGISYQEVTNLLSRLRLLYLLQEAKILPEMLLSINQADYPKEFCASLIFSDEEKEKFNHFVELRASIQN